MLLALHANKRSEHGGSTFGRQKLWRERLEGHNKLIWDYFVDDPTYPRSIFVADFG